jgi:hypothetical protein
MGADTSSTKDQVKAPSTIAREAPKPLPSGLGTEGNRPLEVVPREVPSSCDWSTGRAAFARFEVSLLAQTTRLEDRSREAAALAVCPTTNLTRREGCRPTRSRSEVIARASEAVEGRCEASAARHRSRPYSGRYCGAGSLRAAEYKVLSTQAAHGGTRPRPERVERATQPERAVDLP